MWHPLRTRAAASLPEFHLVERHEGVVIGRQASQGSRPLSSVLVGGLLVQLEEDGRALQMKGEYFIGWNDVFELIDGQADREAGSLLELPSIGKVHVSVSSRDSLEDRTFRIAIDRWRVDDEPVRDAQLTGAVLSCDRGRFLISRELWQLCAEVHLFSLRPEVERTGSENRKAWARIRRLAVSAGAGLDDFLRRTIVLTPERLTIGIRRVDLAGDRVIEIEPGFEGAPQDWLSRFDASRVIPERYDFVLPEGVVQIIVSPEVRTVLQEIKRFQSRRVAGARAQAFIVNPYAALGQHASVVIDEQQFEAARVSAGLTYERFLPQFERDAFSYPVRVGLLIETATSEGPTSSTLRWLDDQEHESFVSALRRALEAEHQLLAWDGFDFELSGDAHRHLQELDTALEERLKPRVMITVAEIYDLSHYTSRVEAIGVEKPYYSPHIVKKRDDDGWFPDNIIPVISWTPEGDTQAVALPFTQDAIEGLRQKVESARVSGAQSVAIAGCPKPIPLEEASNIVEAFTKSIAQVAQGTFAPRKEPSQDEGRQRKSPIIRANIVALDYAEDRAGALTWRGHEPQLPATLRPGLSLLSHQRDGVAWLQALFAAEMALNCRGAVLADDMGLGKTLQVLILAAWAIERDPKMAPVLVVAPVSLLENWKAEIDKFFADGALPVLTAYGDGLAPLRVSRDSIEEGLREEGLVKFLRPGWVGNARIVLTTYETLRDLEFSFARQPWSLMVCDEAQKIKNPAALVTRAAKKQNVRFRVACTGTPVENTLADLWCLFDFVQPGLLGALNDFGHRYRRPIEARTDEERARVEELRRLISPQILRRTKADVAPELPAKVIASSCRRLPLSNAQRALYIHALDAFKKRDVAGGEAPFKNHLGLLHYLRLICTNPSRQGLGVFAPEPLDLYRRRAPKMDWLLTELADIRRRGEKAIVFCEFREIQRLLQHYIHAALDLRPDIVNGDTAPSGTRADSRQRRIDRFQSSTGFGVIILSPAAVGFGLNIQGANHVIHYTRTWNPAKEDQATDRAHRIGQTRTVFVYYPVVCADDFVTFDVRLDQLLEQKRSLAHDMLNGAGDLVPGDFRITDVAPVGSTDGSLDEITPHALRSMTWDYCERLVSVLYAKRGYRTIRTPSQDNGVDVVALARDSKTGMLVQVKSSGHGSALGWEAVKDVVAGQAFYEEQFAGISFSRVCVTNQFFNEQAHRNAKLNAVELVEQPQLMAMLDETPVTMLEIERTFATRV